MLDVVGFDTHAFSDLFVQGLVIGVVSEDLCIVDVAWDEGGAPIF